MMNGEDGRHINPSSSLQIRTLLFGGSFNSVTREQIPLTREFEGDVDDHRAPDLITREEWYMSANGLELKELIKDRHPNHSHNRVFFFF